MQSAPALRVATIPNAGRGIVAERDIQPNELLLQETPYMLVPLVGGRANEVTCLHCAKQFADQPSVSNACEACKERYCSKECQETHEATHHFRTMECTALNVCKRAQGKVSRDDYNTLRGVAAVLCRAKADGVSEEDVLGEGMRKTLYKKAIPDVQTVSTLVEREAAAADSRSCDAISSELHDASNFVHVARLATNLPLFDDDQIASFLSLYNDVYCELQEEFPDDLPAVSEFFFLKLCCSFQCNGFSIWNEHKKEVSSGTYGFAAMVNHSCQPNVKKVFEGRTMKVFAKRLIKKGEQVFFSYVDETHVRNLRQWRLSTQYYFDCCCPRCSSSSEL